MKIRLTHLKNFSLLRIRFAGPKAVSAPSRREKLLWLVSSGFMLASLILTVATLRAKAMSFGFREISSHLGMVLMCLANILLTEAVYAGRPKDDPAALERWREQHDALVTMRPILATVFLFLVVVGEIMLVQDGSRYF